MAEFYTRTVMNAAAAGAVAAGGHAFPASAPRSLPAAAGVPMVATRVGGIPEVFGDDSALVAPGDPQALAEAIAAALADPAATRARAERLRERVRTSFSQDAMVEGILAAYAEAIRAKFQRPH